MDHYAGTVRKCLHVLQSNDSHPYGGWSTGEKVLVALALLDRRYLDAEGYTYAEAMNRVAGGIDVRRDELAEWLDNVRLDIEEAAQDLGLSGLFAMPHDDGGS